MENQHTYFFRPYVGANYNEGFYCLRSLVVGVCPLCEVDCPHHHKCSSAASVKEMDFKCPCYTVLGDGDKEYLRLSNYNTIEIEAFLDGRGKYPSFKNFTYYMLKSSGDLPRQKKCQLWDKVAFTNFLQYFHREEEVLPKDPALFEEAYPAFKEVVEEFKPEVIYVWSKAVRNCLKEHKEDFFYIGKANMQSGIELYLFTPEPNPIKGSALSRLCSLLGVSSQGHREEWYIKLLRTHIGASFGKPIEARGSGTEKHEEKEKVKDMEKHKDFEDEKDKVIAELAQKLRYLVREGILGTTETNLLFNDSDKGKWSSRLKGVFLSAIKDQYPCLGRHFNGGMQKIFNEPHLATAKRDSSKLSDEQTGIAHIISKAFPGSIGKTFSKDWR